jgi:3'(2'), 5'-bisphosphate nucleotidase
MIHWTTELQFAVRCVSDACRLIPQNSESLWMTRKQDGSLVTEADYALQALGGHRLNEAFPGDSFVAEEDFSFLGEHPQALERIVRRVLPIIPQASESSVKHWIQLGEGKVQDRFWLMDPIDSTTGFVKNGVFGILLAGLWEGAVQVAALAYPRGLGIRSPDFLETSGLLFFAGRGLGAWCATLEDPDNIQRLKVSSRAKSEGVRLRSLATVHRDQSEQDLAERDHLSEALGMTQAIRCRATARYPLLALGMGDLYIRLVLSGSANQHLLGWDHAAGSLLVEEAGGRVTDLRGHSLDFFQGVRLTQNHGLVASNGIIHEEVLPITR